MKGSRRRLLVVGVALALAAGTLTAVVMAAAGSPADWPMYHHDEGHSGLAVDTALSRLGGPAAGAAVDERDRQLGLHLAGDRA